MNDHNELVRYVTEHYTEKAAALALVDSAISELDLTPGLAFRYVARIRRDQRNGREFAQAAKVMTDLSGYAGIVSDMVLRYLDWAHWSGVVILIRVGSRPPTWKGNPQLFEGMPAATRYVLVGARWVLAAVRLLKEFEYLNLQSITLHAVDVKN